MEGVVLYVLLVRVFVEGSHKRYIIWFTVASYGDPSNNNNNIIHRSITLYFNIGLPALYMCLTIPLGFLLNGERHYGSDTMSVKIDNLLKYS